MRKQHRKRVRTYKTYVPKKPICKSRNKLWFWKYYCGSPTCSGHAIQRADTYGL